MRRKRGFTLVEFLVVLTIGSTVMALAVGMVHQAMLVAESAQRNSRQSIASNRFFEQFRSDIHFGISIEIDQNQSLAIQLGDKSEVIYAVAKNSITREQRRPNDNVVREEVALNDRAYGTLKFDESNKKASLCVYTETGVKQTLPRLDR